jgi:ribonuclease D
MISNMSTMLVEREGGSWSPLVLEADLDESAFERALLADLVAVDIETTGLDWREDTIGTVQVHVGGATYIVRPNGRIPYRLKAVVEDSAVCKVFHHAMFDLRFLAYKWGIVPARVACTKIASKLAEPDVPCSEHSLAPLLKRRLGISLDKGAQTSDWTGELSEAQLRYAADDVRFLPELYRHLYAELRGRDLLDLRNRCYTHLPTQVELEIGGFPDVFAY